MGVARDVAACQSDQRVVVAAGGGLLVATAVLRFVPDRVVDGEGRDSLWFVVLVAAAVLTVWPSPSRDDLHRESPRLDGGGRAGDRSSLRQRLAGLTFGAALVVIFGGVLVRLDTSPHLSGGSPVIFLVTVSVVVVLNRSAMRLHHSAYGSVLEATLLALVVAALVGGSVVRPDAVPEYLHLAVTTSELAAPIVGLVPFDAFQGQYTNLLGLPLLLTRPVAQRWPVETVLAYHQVLCLLVVVLALAAAVKLVTGKGRVLALVCLALWIGAVSRDGLSGLWMMGAASRNLFGLVVLKMVLAINRGQRINGVRALIAGLGVALALLNNVEFGVIILCAAVCAVALAAGRRPRDRAMAALSVAAAAIGISTTVLLAAARNDLGSVASLWWAVRSTFLGAETWVLPMRVFGLHTSIAGVYLLAIGIGVSALRHETCQSPARATALVYCGLIGLGQLVYFVGRSALEAVVIGSGPWVGLSVAMLIGELQSRSRFSGRAILALLVGMSASVAPYFVLNDVNVRSRTNPSAGKYNFEESMSVESAEAVVGLLERDGVPRSRIGILGKHGNVIALATGTRGAIPVSDPELVLDLPRAVRCRSIDRLALTHVVVSADLADAVAESFDCLVRDSDENPAVRAVDTGWRVLEVIT